MNFRILHNREIELQVERSIAQSPLQPSGVLAKLEQRPAHVSTADFLAFRLLHRQFNGKRNPIFAYTVRVARSVIKRIPALRTRLRK